MTKDFKQAILIAGMHRSGTSALTRVLSIMGAELPGNLAPALPNNNETGFWESVDLMILHDELLKSAGSSWDDWTTFNPNWHLSATGRKFRKKITSVLQNDFSGSELFVIKDPRICRFLPFWLSMLNDIDTRPYIVLPIRNPLEVARSLKARDGLPIATGGLVWLRHVLDSLVFSHNEVRAIVDYRSLVEDWRKVADSISAQLGVVFPRMSPAAEFDVEMYLDPRQKHNYATLDDVKRCRDFSPLLVSVYESLLLLIADPGRSDVLQGLVSAREEFNAGSALYGKVVYANELLHQAKLCQHDENSRSLLQQEKEKHSSLLQQEKEKYSSLLQQKIDANILESKNYLNLLVTSNKKFETKIEEKEKAVNTLSDDLSDSREALMQVRKSFVNLMEERSPATYKLGGSSVQQFLKKDKNKLNQLIRSSSFFDNEFYRAESGLCGDIYSDDAAIRHFLEQNKGENNPHPLFDVSWYLHQYPDVQQSSLNPLVHFIKFGAKELRTPHPLFASPYYSEQYPESNVANLSPLEHYLKYGSEWGLSPHPLFDHQYYIAQLREVVPEGQSSLVHYLGNAHAWFYAPCEAFDGGWYLSEYTDVAKSGINPLLHYIVRGATEGRKPHPNFNETGFQKKFGDLFRQAGFSDELSRARGVQSQQLVSDQRFNKMMAFTRKPLSSVESTFKSNNLIIHWVTCDFAPQGGGGNMTIFRFIRLFEMIGHQQHIWLHNNPVHDQESDAFEDIVRNYQQLSAQVHFVNGNEAAFAEAVGDIVIATDWESVWPVLSTTHFKRRFYFVQDHEPSFFAVGGESLAAEATYHEDLDCICAGPWLKQLMKERYGRWATKFWLAADKNCYYPLERLVENEVPRIAFYARRHTERRAVDLGLLALEYLAQQGEQFHVDVYGGDDNQAILAKASFSFTDHGVINARELGDLYRQCDVGIVFSATNYSLVPQEMMMSGLAVLELLGENTRAVFPKDVVTLVSAHPVDIAKGLSCLLKNKKARLLQAEMGRAWAAQFDWAEEAQQVSDDIQSRLVDLGYAPSETELMPQTFKASVVIPVLNGGNLLVKVVEMVKRQNVPWPFEILVIDSGSTDGALEQIRNLEGCNIHTIPKTEFSHGGTRNLGVEMTSGDYIAFLTQDALPADEFWLFNLVSMLEHEPLAAGVFGAHLPYPEASAFVKRDLLTHFSNLGGHPLYLDKETDAEKFKAGDLGWRQVLHFYSDNNSCMRRSVWKKIPYAVIEYGEDQVWADEIIKAGYKKAYAVNAVVFHSHDYNESETYERSKIEAQFFYEHFGYRLVDSEAGVRQTIAALNESDEKYGRMLQLSENIIEQQKSLNKSRLEGYRDALPGQLS
uniref:O-linked GlcNAc transferase n=1 Tax=uncultured Thiotrichaceae bacterium TaxID=298394 RepID=A0A6S6UKU3_9GAMM|nr:MAG: O-linked GlcNAc transferase [uncultured Thiotrichaceae bacterium]